MKKIMLVLLLAASLVAACSKNKGGSAKLRADVDSVAYILGMNVGMNLLKMDSTLNVNALCEGIRDVYQNSAKLSTAEAEAFYLRYMNFSLPEKARAYEEQFLEDILKNNRSYARTPSGVTYTVEAVGDQQLIPTSDRDSVAVRYLLRTADGQQLYSSYDRGDSLRIMINKLHKGLQESLRLVGKGGKILAWMPSSVAYGAEGNKELGVRPNATLYYEIELVEVDKYANRTRRENLRR